MSGRGRWIGLGLIVACVAAAGWVFLRSAAPEPPLPSGAPGVGASPTPAAGTRAAGRAASPPPQAGAPSAPAPQPPAGQIPPVEVERTTVTTVDAQGRRQWELRADEVVVDGTSNTAVLTRVRGTYYQRGEPAISFSAARGTFYVLTRVVALAGGVRARAASGRTFEAQTVEWSPKTQQVTATGDVVLRQKGLTLRADRLTADTSLRRANLQGNIRVVVEE